MTPTDGKRTVRSLWSSAAALAVLAGIGTSHHRLAAQTIYGCATCQANVQFYGHYPTKWRPWPGETRPDIHFPQSIGAEPVPRPAGEKPPVLPKERLEPVIPRPGQAFPPPPPEEEPLPGTIPPPERPSGEVPGQAPAAPMTPPSGAPPAGPVTPPSSPFQAEPAPLPGTPAGSPGESGGSSPALPPSPPPAPGPAVPPTGAILPGGPELSARGMQDGPNGHSSRMPIDEIRPLAPSAVSSTLRPTVPTPSTPLVVVNPTVAASGNLAVPQSAPSPDKFALQRNEWLPDVTPSQRIPDVPQNLAVNAGYEGLVGVAGSTAPMNAPLTAAGGPGSSGAPGVVWTEDTAPSPGVNPAGYLGGGPSPASSAISVMPPSGREHGPDAATPALGGFCPVELVENETWMKGDRRFAVEYQGRVYHCAGATQKRRFQTNPERYAPVLNGLDPVVYFDQGRSVDGKTEHCVVYDGRLYMFSSIQSLARFRQDPQRYARAALAAH